MATGKKPIRTIDVDTGVNADFLQSVLTQDITTLEALYDLVDNSIDAAKNNLLSSVSNNTDSAGLPLDYSQFSIEITIGRDLVKVVDNCLGIDEVTLRSKAFHTGAASNHKFGIGHFGVGLKRSLLKIGSNYSMATDDGNFLYLAEFNKSQIGGVLDNKMSALVYPSSGHINATFSVTSLHSEIKNDINSAIWFDNAVKGLSRRYAIYTQKGLSLSLLDEKTATKHSINGRVPSLREDGKFLPNERQLNIRGVKIEIRSGIHQDYYFPREEKHSLSTNRKLTNEFGMYFICNDRVIVSSSTEFEHGWKSKWHSEYNGYVCLINFYAENPSDLPLNTAKTGIRTDSPLFLELREILQPIADHYRSEIKNRYPSKEKPSKGTGRGAGGSKKGTSSTAAAGGTGSSTAGGYSHGTGQPNPSNNNSWSTLLPYSIICQKHPKMASLVDEATRLPLTYPYAGTLLLRSVLETLLFEFVKADKHLAAVKQMVFDEKAKEGSTFSDAQKKSYKPGLEQITLWLSRNPDAFPDDDRRECQKALTKLRNVKPMMNGVVHEKDLISDSKLRNIRDDIYHLVDFMLNKFNDQKP